MADSVVYLLRFNTDPRFPVVTSALYAPLLSPAGVINTRTDAIVRRYAQKRLTGGGNKDPAPPSTANASHALVIAWKHCCPPVPRPLSPPPPTFPDQINVPSNQLYFGNNSSTIGYIGAGTGYGISNDSSSAADTFLAAINNEVTPAWGLTFLVLLWSLSGTNAGVLVVVDGANVQPTDYFSQMTVGALSNSVTEQTVTLDAADALVYNAVEGSDFSPENIDTLWWWPTAPPFTDSGAGYTPGGASSWTITFI